MITKIKSGLATASVREYRGRMYPLKKHSNEVYSPTDNTFGGIRIEINESYPTARLSTVHHRDILDAVHACYTDFFPDSAGQLIVEFDHIDVLDMLGLDKNIDWRDLHRRLTDLIGNVITIWDKDNAGNPDSFSILSRVKSSKILAQRKNWQINSGKTYLKQIVYSSGYVELMKQEGRLFLSKGNIKTILSMKNAASRACSRWLVSHRDEQHQDIKRVLEYCGFDGKKSQLYKYIEEIRQDKDCFESLQIKIQGNKFHSERLNSVFFQKRNENLVVDVTLSEQGFPVQTAVIPVQTAVIPVQTAVFKEVFNKEASI
jgi:hypothetical protein